MSPAFERIDYSIRPAKQVERRLIIECLSALRGPFNLDRYRYVGFGSLWFMDSLLVHEHLGVANQVSIEKNVTSRSRFEFNLPLRSIRMMFTDSTSALDELLQKRQPTIAWLDYESRPKGRVKDDVSRYCANAYGGDVLMITVCATPLLTPVAVEAADADEKEEQQDLADSECAKLQRHFGSAAPLSLTPADLTPEHLPRHYYETLSRFIENVIDATNTRRNAGARVSWKQLFHFVYQDGALMMTLGGIFSSPHKRNAVNSCDFARSPGYNPSRDAQEIQIPVLTTREVLWLRSRLPARGNKKLRDDPSTARTGVPARDMDLFEAVERFYPAFNETVVR